MQYSNIDDKNLVVLIPSVDNIVIRDKRMSQIQPRCLAFQKRP